MNAAEMAMISTINKRRQHRQRLFSEGPAMLFLIPNRRADGLMLEDIGDRSSVPVAARLTPDGLRCVSYSAAFEVRTVSFLMCRVWVGRRERPSRLPTTPS